MRRAYLETSAINHAVDDGRDPTGLRLEWSEAGLVPVVGLHVIYELARTFLNPNTHARARRLFTFLQLLDPSYGPESRNLLMQEVVRLRTNAAVLPFLSCENQAATRSEVARLAAGTFDAQARRFIQEREMQRRGTEPAGMLDYVSHVRRLRETNPTSVNRIRTEDDLCLRFKAKMPQMIQEILRRSVTLAEAKELFLRLREFPALRATVYANLALMLPCITQGVPPRIDKLDDYRHVIEAAYCDLLVTDDHQLTARAKAIHPELHVAGFSDVIAG